MNSDGVLKNVSPPSGSKIPRIAKKSTKQRADDNRNQKDHLLSLVLGNTDIFILTSPLYVNIIPEVAECQFESLVYHVFHLKVILRM